MKPIEAPDGDDWGRRCAASLFEASWEEAGGAAKGIRPTEIGTDEKTLGELLAEAYRAGANHAIEGLHEAAKRRAQGGRGRFESAVLRAACDVVDGEPLYLLARAVEALRGEGQN